MHEAYVRRGDRLQPEVWVELAGLLTVAALLHDVGKRRNGAGDHSVVGEPLARATSLQAWTRWRSRLVLDLATRVAAVLAGAGVLADERAAAVANGVRTALTGERGQ